MKFIKHYLPDTEYYKTEYPKEQIYLHHTVSSSAASAMNWWKQDGVHVATAYVIDKDGTVYETFEPKYWSYHLGLRGTGGSIDKKSIGIEIVNEGWLTKRDNTFLWFNGKAVYRGPVHELGVEWRGQKYFAAYTEAQVRSAAIVTKILAYNMNIPFNFIGHLNYDKNLASSFTGILNHCNVRSDKTDISPAFPMNDFISNASYLENNPILPRGLDKIGA